MGNWLRAGFGALALSLSVGCSSSSSSDSNSPAPATGQATRTANPDQVRSALKPVLEAYCGWLFKCCTAGELAQTLGPAASNDCADHLIQSATVSYPYGLTGDTGITNLLLALNYVQYGFDQSAITIDTAAVSACSSAISARDCNPAPPVDHCAPTPPAANDACAIDKLLVGSLPAGADCASGVGANPCAPGLTCRAVGNSGGVCIAAAAAGDLCLRDEDCGSKLVCDWTNGTCSPGKAYGETCAFSDPSNPVLGTEATRCAPGLLCDATKLKCADPNCATGTSCTLDSQCPKGTACVMNRCGALRKAGETCFQGKDCENGSCTYDSIAQRSLCSRPKAEGALCQSPADCESGFCSYDQTAMQQVCKATLKDGETCAQGEQCASGKCDTTGMCAAVAAGGACTGDTDCAPSHDLFCVAKKCAKAPFANGVTCTSDQQCKSGACVGGKCTAKGAVGDTCGTSTDAPCDAGEYCNVAAGKDAGKCVALKAGGEPCTRDAECASSCSSSQGELRCMGEPPGVAACSGT